MRVLMPEHFPVTKYETFSIKDGSGKVVETWTHTGSATGAPKGKKAETYTVVGYRHTSSI